MGLTELAKATWETITTNKVSGFGVDMKIITPDNITILDIIGIHSKHNIRYDPETGNLVNGKSAHCSFSENLLITASYPHRNSDEEIDLKKHKIFVKDSSGVEKKYIINETIPDETLGVILCVLGDYE